MELVQFSAIWDDFSSGQRSRQRKSKIVTVDLDSRVDEFLLGIEILNFVKSVYTELEAFAPSSQTIPLRTSAMHNLLQRKSFATRIFIEDDRRPLFQITPSQQLRGTFVIFEFDVLDRRTFSGNLRSKKVKTKSRRRGT